MEHSDIDAPLIDNSGSYLDLFDNDFETENDTETCKEQATMKFQPGGKGTPGQQNLYVISASAKQGICTKWPIPLWESPEPQVFWPVPSQEIAIGGLGNLGADGNLYFTLPAGSGSVVATPTVSGMTFYTVSPNPPVEIPITIIANGIDLSQNTPTFCVGQQINFALSTLPTYVNAVVNWNLPGKYVNESWQQQQSINGDLFPYGSVNYRVDSSLLSYTTNGGITTSCWYVNKPGGTVSVGVNFLFSNGQTASIAAAGTFNIYRPEVVVPNPIGILPYGTSFYPTTCQLILDSNQMNFILAISSTFPGQEAYAQLINADRYSDIPGDYEITGGYWLDNSYPYDTPIDVAANQNPGTYIRFTDGPGFAGLNTVSVNDNFKTYLIFKPNPLDTSIWVTLREIDWSWNASAQIIPWQVTLPPPTFTAPYDTDVMPQWLHQLYNGEIVP